MKVCFKSPCRIDLAGGTQDLWPLYHFFDDAQIIHMAISINSYCQIEHNPISKKFSLSVHSLDLGKKKSFSSIQALKKYAHNRQNPLSWLALVSHYFLSQTETLSGHYILRTKSEIPPGSGLGGSSVMGVSLAKAWLKILSLKVPRALALQSILRNLESVQLGKPAGEQDYIPALFGGLLCFKLTYEGKTVRPLNSDVAQYLAEHCCLIYTGKPHHSGLNNWDIYQKFLSKHKQVCASLQDINTIANKMISLAEKGNFKNFARLLNAEWTARQKLSPTVNAKELQQAWKLARKHGATARKACGAGGGGCLLVCFNSPQKKHAFQEQHTPKHWQLYPIHPAKKGCFVAPCL